MKIGKTDSKFEGFVSFEWRVWLWPRWHRFFGLSKSTWRTHLILGPLTIAWPRSVREDRA